MCSYIWAELYIAWSINVSTDRDAGKYKVAYIRISLDPAKVELTLGGGVVYVRKSSGSVLILVLLLHVSHFFWGIMFYFGQY